MTEFEELKNANGKIENVANKNSNEFQQDECEIDRQKTEIENLQLQNSILQEQLKEIKQKDGIEFWFMKEEIAQYKKEVELLYKKMQKMEMGQTKQDAEYAADFSAAMSGHQMLRKSFLSFSNSTEGYPIVYNQKEQQRKTQNDCKDYGKEDENYESCEEEFGESTQLQKYISDEKDRAEKLARQKGTFVCNICNIACVGEQPYKAHLEGKKHQKMMAQKMANNKATFHCKICNVNCSGEDSYKMHIDGKKHQKAIFVLMNSKNNEPTIVCKEMTKIVAENLDEILNNDE